MNRHGHDSNYRLELRHAPRETTPSIDHVTEQQTENSKTECVSDQTTIRSHIHKLEKNNSDLYQDMDYLKLQLLSQQELKGRLFWLQKEYSVLDMKYQSDQSAHTSAMQHLQEQLDKTSLIQRKTEDQLLVMKSSEMKGPKTVLDQIQEKYTEEVTNLTSELRVKDRSLQEMRNDRIELVSALTSVECIMNV